MAFSREYAVKAVRKAAQCIGCHKIIPVGDPAMRWAGMSEGDFCSVAYHPDCREAEVKLNELHGTFGDEWFSLGDIDWEDFPWLLETYPAVAARKGITAELIAENEA